jgi:hypothetical protein
METDLNHLKELVNRHKVCSKVWPELTYVNGEKRQIGYELELAGTHEPWVEHPQPGCEHCQRIFIALREIAEWIRPREDRASVTEIEPFDQSIRYWSQHGKRPDVILTLKVIHGNDFALPVDECEDRCLKEMQQRLLEIGVGAMKMPVSAL